MNKINEAIKIIEKYLWHDPENNHDLESVKRSLSLVKNLTVSASTREKREVRRKQYESGIWSSNPPGL